MESKDSFTISKIERVVLILAGISNIIMGYAIYFILKNDKEKKEYAEFIHRGAMFGLILTIIAFILGLIFGLMGYLI